MSKYLAVKEDLTAYLQDLEEQTRSLADQCSYLKGQRDSLRTEIDRLKTSKLNLSEGIEKRERIVIIFGKLIEILWDEARKLIEEIMPYGLRLVFGGELSFKIESDVAANQAVADLVFLDAGRPRDLADAEGGSVSDVVSTLLRMIVLLRSGRRRVIILDEPFKMIDLDKEHLVLRLLAELSEALEIQIIMVTHHKGFQDPDMVDRCFMIDKQGGKTVCISHT